MVVAAAAVGGGGGGGVLPVSPRYWFWCFGSAAAGENGWRPCKMLFRLVHSICLSLASSDAKQDLHSCADQALELWLSASFSFTIMPYKCVCRKSAGITNPALGF